MEAIKKYAGYASYGVALLFIIIGFMFYATSADGVAISTDLFLYGSYLFIILVIVGIIGGFAIGAITDSSKMMKSLISAGIVLVLFFVFYTIADGTVTEELKKIKGTFDVTSFAIKLTEASFYIVYLLMLGILGALGWGTVKSFID